MHKRLNVYQNKYKTLLLQANVFQTPLYWCLSKLVETNFYRKFAKNYLSTVNLRLIGGPKFDVFQYPKIEAAIKNRLSKDHGIVVYFGSYRGGLSWTVEHELSDCMWGHAGILVVTDKGIETRNITSHGFLCEYLPDYLAKIDDFAVGFFPMSAATEKEAYVRLNRVMEAVARGQVDYDYSMHLTQNVTDFISKGIPLPAGNLPLQLYCSELVYEIVNVLTPNVIVPTWLYDRYIVEPDNVYLAAEHLFEEINP